MENILLAIDGSEPSQKAAEKALKLAKVFSAKVTIISVAVPVPTPIHWSGTHFYYEEHLKRQKEQAEEILEKQKKLFHENSIEVTTVLKTGDPADEICQFANSGDFNMIIMGSKGLSGIKRALIGSVANYVIQCSNIPVFVVK